MRSVTSRPLVSALAVLSLGTFILSGCRNGDSRSEQVRTTLFDSRDSYDPRSLDPALSTDVPTGRAVSYLFDGLTRFTPDGKVEPGLAERWDVSGDGMVYTFHLRNGVRFHDGSPFLARHVRQSFRRVLDPASRGGRGQPLFAIQGARAYADGQGKALGIATPDDSTVIITLEEPLAIFPKMLALPVASILPDSAGTEFGQHPIGTGPWRLVEWKHDDYLKFAKNSEYFGGAPKFDTLVARIIPEPTTAVAEFESGTVDVLYVPEDQTRDWESTDEKKARLHSAPALRLWYLGVNVTRGPLKDVRVRKAIAQAIDTRTLLAQLLNGRGRVAAGVIPPALEGADTTRVPFAYDTVAARKLLADAGFANGMDLELWSSQTPPFPRLAETIQAYLKTVGIRVKLVQRDAATMRAAARAGQTDLVLKDWFADYPDAENFLYPLLHSSSKGVGGNVSFYANPAFDTLVNQSRGEPDAARRAELYRQADSLAYADVGLVPLFFYNDLFAIQPWVKGFQVPVIFTGQRWTAVTLGK
jgi:peptide/nickel transport system substrate-binding protein/oligopeptide transport system substrate-binding protein